MLELKLFLAFGQQNLSLWPQFDKSRPSPNSPAQTHANPLHSALHNAGDDIARELYSLQSRENFQTFISHASYSRIYRGP